MTSESYRPRGNRRPEDDAIYRAQRRDLRLRQELLVRAGVAVLILIFNEAAGVAGQPDPEIRTAALVGLGLNGPYYLLAHWVPWRRAQAYGRLLGDVALLTWGLYGGGGLAAAPYVAVYMIVPVYAGVVLSSQACLVATGAATAGYLLVALLQRAGSLPITSPLPPNAWAVAIFNLLVLNIVGVLIAILARAYRHNRRRLAALHQDLERAYDESSRLNAELQRSARLHVLGEVLAGVAHEIGNALQSALLPIELVRQKAGAAVPEVLRHLEQIEYGCSAAIGVVKNVLQTARQSTDDKIPVSLPEIARRTVELKGYSLRRDGIAIRLEFPPDFPAVVGQPFRLQQVLLNLVANAQEALHDGVGNRSIGIVGSAG
jgi:signal transduction histidine kinase